MTNMSVPNMWYLNPNPCTSVCPTRGYLTAYAVETESPLLCGKGARLITSAEGKEQEVVGLQRIIIEPYPGYTKARSLVPHNN